MLQVYFVINPPPVICLALVEQRNCLAVGPLVRESDSVTFEKRRVTMRDFIIAIIIMSLLALTYINREKLDCHERTYVRHGLDYKITHCVVIDD